MKGLYGGLHIGAFHVVMCLGMVIFVHGEEDTSPGVSNSMRHPLDLFPSAKTCLQQGALPGECSPTCLAQCQTPICEFSCLCACQGEEQKQSLAAMLAAESQELKLIVQQGRMWRAGLSPRDKHSVHRKQKQLALAMGNNDKAAPHEQQPAHQPQQAAPHAPASAAPRRRRAADTDSTGFSWGDLGPANAKKVYVSPYANEAEDEINVYDPTLDPENEGNGRIGQPSMRGWWDDGGRWWEHGGEGGR